LATSTLLQVSEDTAAAQVTPSVSLAFKKKIPAESTQVAQVSQSLGQCVIPCASSQANFLHPILSNPASVENLRVLSIQVKVGGEVGEEVVGGEVVGGEVVGGDVVGGEVVGGEVVGGEVVGGEVVGGEVVEGEVVGGEVVGGEVVGGDFPLLIKTLPPSNNESPLTVNFLSTTSDFFITTPHLKNKLLPLVSKHLLV